MTQTLQPFGSIERAVLAFLEASYAPLGGHPERVGGDLPGELSELYVRIDRVFGRADTFEGSFTVDIEVFHPSYDEAENAAMDIEALVLGYPHVVKVGDRTVVFDRVTENQGPSEVPWDDDNVHRLLATYVITARRPTQ